MLLIMDDLLYLQVLDCLTKWSVNWKQLLREIAEELELDIEKESDLVAIAQYYYNKNGCNRTKLNDTIKDAFQTGKQPNVNHKYTR